MATLCHKHAGKPKERLVDKRIVYGLVAAAVILALGAYFMFGRSSANVADSGNALPYEVLATDHVRGAASAPITIIEYAAMHCPFCARFERDVVPKLIQNYVNTGKVRMVFRDFPLIGPDWLASGLTHCVPPDKFFSFLDLLFANQDKWVGPGADANHDGSLSEDEVIEGLVQMGRMAGFSREKVESCISDKTTLASLDQVQKDAEAKYKVDHTPTFIINGEIYNGELTYQDMQKKLDAQLTKK